MLSPPTGSSAASEWRHSMTRRRQGEFGRMPDLSKRHRPRAMPVWMAGVGITGGQVIGVSDEFGLKAEQQVMSVHDLHAAILRLLGLDHTKLTLV